MQRIVYASDNYNPPAGVIVLPLEAHPALIEDALNGWTNTSGGRGYTRKAPLTITDVALAVADFLRSAGSATAYEIAIALNLSRGGVYYALTSNPHLFEVCGERRSQSNRWKSVAVWVLVQEE